jgi:hypothetical protein
VSIKFTRRLLRTTGLFIMDLLTAVLGPAILEGSVWRLLPLHSVSAVVLKERCLDVTCAALMGFLMYRTWHSASSKWVWILPALWFAFRAIPYAGRSHVHSVFSQESGFWTHFSGAGCGAEVSDCRDFFSFAVPLIRALSYSGAAVLASRILKPPTADARTNADTKTAGDENPTNA